MLGFITTLPSSGINYYPKVFGGLTVLATWGTNADGTGSSPSNFTSASQVFILTRANAFINSSWTVSGAGSYVQVGNGVSAVNFNFGASGSFTGTIYVQNNGTLSWRFAAAPVLGTLSAGSTVNYSGDTAQQIAAASYYNLTLSGASTTRIKTVNGNISISNVLNVQSSNTLELGTNRVLSVSSPVTGTGTITTSSTHASPIPSNITWEPFIFYGASSPQTIVDGVYSDLQLGGAGSIIKSLGGNITVGGVLRINSSKELSLGGYTLTLNGTIHATSTGTIRGSPQSSIIIGPSSSAADAGSLLMSQTNDETRSLFSLTISRNTGANALIIGNPLRIIRSVNITNGTLNGNGNVTFVSSSASTSAQLSTVTGTGAVSGNFTVQRYIDGRDVNIASRWRFLASPVLTSNGIDDNWQQQIFITGPGTGGSICPTLTANSNGFDRTSTNNPSFFYWNTLNLSWTSIANTTNTNLTPGHGYLVSVKGARTQGCSLITGNAVYNPDDVVLSATGTLITGNVSAATTANLGEYALIGNPYQATINWESGAIDRGNSGPTIYAFNHTIGQDGAYGTFNNGIGTNGVTQYISPGTAFWVECTDSEDDAFVLFREGAKVSDSAGFALFKSATNLNLLRIKLKKNTGINQHLDEVVFASESGCSWNYKPTEDAKKMSAGTIGLGLNLPGSPVKYAICRVPGFDTVNNRVNLELYASVNTAYSFDFVTSGLFTNSYRIWLTDTYRGIIHDVSVNPSYSFITTDSSSFLPSRFYITIAPSVIALPVNLIAFSGNHTLEGNKLHWMVANEINLSHYEIERSENNRDFIRTGTVQSNGLLVLTGAYSYTDISDFAKEGNPAYYRLKIVDKDGGFTYSPNRLISNVVALQGRDELKVFPVPARNKLYFSNHLNSSEQEKVRVTDISGKNFVFSAEHDLNGYHIDISDLAAGVYLFQTPSGKGVKFIKE